MWKAKRVAASRRAPYGLKRTPRGTGTRYRKRWEEVEYAGTRQQCTWHCWDKEEDVGRGVSPVLIRR